MRATKVWLAFNQTTSVTFGELSRCLQRIARVGELGSCQSYLCHSLCESVCPSDLLSAHSIWHWVLINLSYTTLTNFSTKYLVICKVYTDVGGIK